MVIRYETMIRICPSLVRIHVFLQKKTLKKKEVNHTAAEFDLLHRQNKVSLTYHSLLELSSRAKITMCCHRYWHWLWHTKYQKQHGFTTKGTTSILSWCVYIYNLPRYLRISVFPIMQLNSNATPLRICPHFVLICFLPIWIINISPILQHKWT